MISLVFLLKAFHLSGILTVPLLPPLQMHTAATIANLSAFPEFIDHLMSARCCSTIVYLLNKGNVASKREVKRAYIVMARVIVTLMFCP